MAAIPVWDLFRTFLAAAQTGSLTAAARRLESTQPTVGRQIETLERELGVNLFVRSQRGLALTKPGAELLVHVEEMAAIAGAATRGLSAETDTEGGVVRLSVPEFMAMEVLPPVLAGFCHRYPNIEIELSVSSRNADLLQGEADVAVRMNKPTQAALVARRIGTVAVGLFAHRRYAEAFGLPQTPAELSAHRTIGFDQDFHIMQTSGPAAAAIRREDFKLRCDSVAVQLALLRAGAGITACQEPVARRDPDMVPVLANQLQFPREVWTVMHEDLRRVRRVRLLFDTLASALKAYLSAGDPSPRAHEGGRPPTEVTAEHESLP